jgi:acetyl esterase/lipase
VHFDERVDPELAATLPSIPDFDLNDIDAARQKRLALAAARRASWVPPDGVLVADHGVVAPDGRPGPRVRVYSPRALAAPVPCLYWVHGGGFVIGDLEQDDPLLADLVGRVGCVAASVDWRRAPEHPFPAAPEDAYDGLVWVATHTAQLLVDPARIVIGGASAGGGLAAALAHMARDRGGPSITHQILVYPMLDDREITASSRSAVHPRLWNVERNRIAWRHYLGELSGSDEVPPYAAPARATDLARLPPTWLAAGELDLFADENIAYAQALMAAGVSTELHVYAGAYHGFDLLAPTAAISRRYVRDRQEMFDRTLRPE